MGDFASPAVGPNGSICINNSMNPGSGSGVPAGAVGIPKHSAVVERLRQRIEGCRRHHAFCENRYQQAHSEQLEIDRRETVNLYQRTLEQRAKKNNTLIAVRRAAQSGQSVPPDPPLNSPFATQHTLSSPRLLSPLTSCTTLISVNLLTCSLSAGDGSLNTP
uniref:Neurogenic mastermind-like N-terminal domain-containing protein n=1 Tax=Nothobranchius furzeri TaxID=105023 RepID=A0A8C6LI85_NOTFU